MRRSTQIDGQQATWIPDRARKREKHPAHSYAFVAAFEILSFGAIIVLIVLGLGIIASMMGIFNFAQGEFVLLGAYITYLAYAKGLPIWAGMVAAPFVVGALGFVLEALIIRRFYAAPIVAMLGTYALGLIIRESVRGLIGGFYLDRAGADRRLDRYRRHAHLGLALHHHRHHAAGDGRLLSAAVAHQLRPARARHAGKSGAGAGLRHLHAADVRRHLCVRLPRSPALPAR